VDYSDAALEATRAYVDNINAVGERIHDKWKQNAIRLHGYADHQWKPRSKNWAAEDRCGWRELGPDGEYCPFPVSRHSILMQPWASLPTEVQNQLLQHADVAFEFGYSLGFRAGFDEGLSK
jgi:hypothetical protein